MAGPLYFFPKLAPNDLRDGSRLITAPLERADLADVLDGIVDAKAEMSFAHHTGHGPGRLSGTVCTVLTPGQDPPPRLQFAPDFQTWQRYNDHLWVGIDKELPPTPADLARPQSFPGWFAKLAGQQFVIPVIRDPEAGTALPKTWRYDADGAFVETIKRRWVDLWERTEAAVDLFFDPETPDEFQVDAEWALGLCREILNVNYRYGKPTQNLLDLVDSTTWPAILSAAVDVPTFNEAFADATRARQAKKNGQPPESTTTTSGGDLPEPDLTRSTPGPEAGDQTTPQAVES